MLMFMLNTVSVYVNNNRSFNINVNAIVIMMCTLNLIGLVPGGMAYLGNIVSLGGIMVWIGVVLSLVINNFGKFCSDLVPSAPISLVPLLYVIELVSYFVRPCAMFLRISINLSCGHLLLVICGMLGVWGNFVSLGLILTLEFGVAVVQSFVYGIILVL